MSFLDGVKGAISAGGVVVKADCPNKFKNTMDHYDFTVTLTNKTKELRTINGVEFRIRTATDIANTGPAEQIIDGFYYDHRENFELAAGESKTLSIRMPVFAAAQLEETGVEVPGWAKSLAKGAAIAAKSGKGKKYVLQSVPDVAGFKTKRTFGKKLKSGLF